jgi:hypothetical protein
LLLLLGLASPALPQDAYRAILDRQMSTVQQAIAANGYREDVGATSYVKEDTETVVSLGSGSDVGLEVVLQGGLRYRVYTEPADFDVDDCGKTLQDGSGNTLFSGTWSEDRWTNDLDFTAPASGTYILVADCDQNSGGFLYDIQSMAPGDSVFRTDPGAYPADMIVGFLKAGATVGLEVVLDRGVEYMIVGVCDQDCRDLDLALADGNDAILFTDELDDDAPVLEFTSPANGLHTLWVTMYACSIEPCSFAYKVFRR